MVDNHAEHVIFSTFFGNLAALFFAHLLCVAGIAIYHVSGIQIFKNKIAQHSHGKNYVLVNTAIFRQISKNCRYGCKHSVKSKNEQHRKLYVVRRLEGHFSVDSEIP